MSYILYVLPEDVNCSNAVVLASSVPGIKLQNIKELDPAKLPPWLNGGPILGEIESGLIYKGIKCIGKLWMLANASSSPSAASLPVSSQPPPPEKEDERDVLPLPPSDITERATTSAVLPPLGQDARLEQEEMRRIDVDEQLEMLQGQVEENEEAVLRQPLLSSRFDEIEEPSFPPPDVRAQKEQNITPLPPSDIREPPEQIFVAAPVTADQNPNPQGLKTPSTFRPEPRVQPRAAPRSQDKQKA